MGEKRQSERCRILLVEDERIVRTALRYIIEQEKDTYEIIGEVTNGEEALAFLEHDIPHVMICDIMMPKLDGLGLLRVANSKYPEISSIVLSGYQEFDYVKRAFQYGVADYILKPELEAEYLLKLLGKIVKNQGLMLEKASGETAAVQDCPFHYLIGVRPGGVLEKAQKKQELVVGVIEEHIRNAFGRFYIGSRVIQKQMFFYEIGCPYPAVFSEKSAGFLSDVRQYLRNVELIISRPCTGAYHPEEEIQKLTNRFSYRFFNPDKEYLDMERDCAASASHAMDAKKVYALVRRQKIGEAYGLLADDLSSFCNTYEISESELKKEVENILYNTIFELQDTLCGTEELEEKKLLYLSEIAQAKSIEFLEAAVRAIGDELMHILETRREGDALYYQILDYIQNHFKEPITLKTLAEDFNMSYSYLSSYLSSRMGQGMNEYLNTIRVEEAKKLLSGTDLPLAEIAHQIGYTDQSYFGKVFKKLVGIPPLAYRGKRSRE